MRWRHDRVGSRVEVLEDAADQPSRDAATTIADVDGDVLTAFDREHWNYGRFCSFTADFKYPMLY